VTVYIDANPPYVFKEYIDKLIKVGVLDAGSALRGPSQELVKLPPSWYHDSRGPVFDRIPVGPDDNDLYHQHEGQPLGERITLFGRVLDIDGNGVPGALLEIWQANAGGRYVDPTDPGFNPLDPNFTGVGRCITDSTGAYRFFTIRPAPYAGIRGDVHRPAHIHLSVMAWDLSSRLITQCYFPGDRLVGQDWIATSIMDWKALRRLTASLRGDMLEPTGVDTTLAYEWDIVLRGHAPNGAQARGALTPSEVSHVPDPALLLRRFEDEIPEDLAAAPDVTSPSQTIGPLYAGLMFNGAEIAAAPDDPNRVVVRGRILDGTGSPIPYPAVMVEVWEGEQFARTRTDPQGEFRAVLRKPEKQHLPGGEPLAPYFHVTVFAQGLLKQAQTRMYFPDEAQANAADPVLQAVPAERRSTLVARRAEDGDLVFDVAMQGPSETVFFDF
jgi:protocatechuate 3,4-dioxygenase beta subunit